MGQPYIVLLKLRMEPLFISSTRPHLLNLVRPSSSLVLSLVRRGTGYESVVVLLLDDCTILEYYRYDSYVNLIVPECMYHTLMRMKPDTLLSYALPAEHEVLNLVFRCTGKRGSTCTVLLITLLSNRYRLVVAAILKLYIYLRCTLGTWHGAVKLVQAHKYRYSTCIINNSTIKPVSAGGGCNWNWNCSGRYMCWYRYSTCIINNSTIKTVSAGGGWNWNWNCTCAVKPVQIVLLLWITVLSYWFIIFIRFTVLSYWFIIFIRFTWISTAICSCRPASACPGVFRT